MLSFLRNFAKTPVAKIFLFMPLLFAFGFIFQTSDFLHPKLSDAVVEAGPRSIGENEFKQSFDAFKRRTEQERNGGEPIPVEEFVKSGVPAQMADQMATEQAFGAWLTRTGFRPSEKLITHEIQNNKAFYNPYTGKFDKQEYQQILAQNGMTEERFLQVLGDEIAGMHFDQGIVAGLHAPIVYTAVQASLAREKRDATWFKIDPKAAGVPSKPTDDQLKTFVTEHGLKIPEVRTMSVVLFSPRTVMDQVKADPDQVKKAYEFEKDSLSQAETRNFVQIPASNAADAQAISQALKAGADPAAVARSKGVKPIDYPGRPKSAVSDPAVAASAFSLKAGETSGPIKGAFGWSVVKVQAITPGKVKTFDEAKGDIEAKIKQKLAEAKSEDLVQKYQDLRDKNVSMEDAAKQVGLTLLHYPPITKTGTLANGQPIRLPNGQPFPFPKAVLDTLYSTPKGGQNESPQETGNPHEYFALRVDDVSPTHMLAIDDQTRPQLSQAWMQEAAAKLQQAKADELLARLKKGESFDAVAKSIGAKVETRQDFGRIQPPQKRDEYMAMMKTDPEALIVAQAFGAQAVGKPFAVDCDPIAHLMACKAIMRIDAVHAPIGVVAAGDIVRYQQLSDRALAQGFDQTVRKTAREKLKAKVYKDRIDSVVGGGQQGQTPAKGQ